MLISHAENIEARNHQIPGFEILRTDLSLSSRIHLSTVSAISLTTYRIIKVHVSDLPCDWVKSCHTDPTPSPLQLKQDG
ncbi:hypothetical protein Y1Q_0019958 [Alligator mississippiensis]|uniref:Uncharacterized protein n=1 Tax=Alligator mississippiensis TaxID=8496 RepID=A0A151PE75_ALLMI|nr:hypothetical protein Y1Q_0019958 [Alligator mississippiensis]